MTRHPDQDDGLSTCMEFINNVAIDFICFYLYFHYFNRFTKPSLTLAIVLLTACPISFVSAVQKFIALTADIEPEKQQICYRFI